ncbi:transcription termination factor Rho [Akkermansiaceae bacterium]|nr:transcription termination factor Rho [Akkermansiaceae bacterium]
MPDEINLNEFRNEPLSDLYDEVERLPVRIPNQVTRAQLAFTILSCYATHGTRIEGEGVLEFTGGNYAMIRDEARSFRSSPDDIYVPAQMLQEHGLREGQRLKVSIREPKHRDKFLSALEILEIEGVALADYEQPTHFDSLTSLFPEERFVLEGADDGAGLATRVVDLVAPLGKGQRGLIVAPPRGGKTILLKQIAKSIQMNSPGTELVILLLDERPEEVTDFEEMVGQNVFASTFDEPSKRHADVANLVLERSRRLVEQGKDVVILLDSLTRLARGYNNASRGGPIGSGGVSPKAITETRKFFGAARNVEEAGQLDRLPVLKIGGLLSRIIQIRTIWVDSVFDVAESSINHQLRKVGRNISYQDITTKGILLVIRVSITVGISLRAWIKSGTILRDKVIEIIVGDKLDVIKQGSIKREAGAGPDRGIRSREVLAKTNLNAVTPGRNDPRSTRSEKVDQTTCGAKSGTCGKNNSINKEFQNIGRLREVHRYERECPGPVDPTRDGSSLAITDCGRDQGTWTPTFWRRADSIKSRRQKQGTAIQLEIKSFDVRSTSDIRHEFIHWHEFNIIDKTTIFTGGSSPILGINPPDIVADIGQHNCRTRPRPLSADEGLPNLGNAATAVDPETIRTFLRGSLPIEKQDTGSQTIKTKSRGLIVSETNCTPRRAWLGHIAVIRVRELKVPRRIALKNSRKIGQSDRIPQGHGSWTNNDVNGEVTFISIGISQHNPDGIQPGIGWSS